MRKKIFIIHGKGVNRGIGKEGGGDLDTVSSSAFYMVWAKNALKEELGREPVYGEDFEVDFINYSEGVSHLAVHSGCDIYLPDFPEFHEQASKAGHGGGDFLQITILPKQSVAMNNLG